MCKINTQSNTYLQPSTTSTKTRPHTPSGTSNGYQIERLVTSFKLLGQWSESCRNMKPRNMHELCESWRSEYVYQQGVFYGLNWNSPLYYK